MTIICNLTPLVLTVEESRRNGLMYSPKSVISQKSLTCELNPMYDLIDNLVSSSLKY